MSSIVYTGCPSMTHSPRRGLHSCMCPGCRPATHTTSSSMSRSRPDSVKDRLTMFTSCEELKESCYWLLWATLAGCQAAFRCRVDVLLERVVTVALRLSVACGSR